MMTMGQVSTIDKNTSCSQKLIYCSLKEKIEKLFRICLGSLSAAACAKNDSMGYAAGLSCGAIKLFSLRKPSIHHHKFIGGNFNSMPMNDKFSNF